MENIFVEFLPPWVETGLQPAFYDKESGTVLQQTARMYARVNMLIRMFNKLSKNTKTEVERFETAVNEDMTQYKKSIDDTVEEYIEKFNQLHDYVEDYFDNLDVQEEINNKLDAMAEAGTLQEIIYEYINAKAIFCYDTVASMKSATNLVDGSYAETLGYHARNDGGSGLYKIRTKLVTDTVNEMTLIAIGSTLVAELVIEDTINSKQCGLLGDGTTNEVTNLNTFFALPVNAAKVLNKGVYVASSTVFIKGTWGDQTPYRQTVTFDKASIKYTGTANGCSIAIFNFQRGDINGVNIAHASNDNYVMVLGCWFTNINGMECRDLKLTTDSTVISSLGYDSSAIMNLNFNGLRLWHGTLNINSLNESYINSVYFYNSTINATDKSVCVDITSENATENITFNCSDFSYADDAVFKLSNTYPVRSTLNVNNSYFDSNLPLFLNDNTENFLLTFIGNYMGNGFKHLPYDYRSVSNMVSLGSHTNDANILACENVNYAINGDMSSSNILDNSSSIMGRSNTGANVTREYITTSLNANNRGRRITWGNIPSSGVYYENITIAPVPRDGYYTAFIRMKVTGGTFTSLELRFAGNYHQVTRSEVPNGKEILLTYSSHTPITGGTTPSCYLQFNGVTAANLQIEVYEFGVVYGTTVIPYPKLHELAKL